MDEIRLQKYLAEAGVASRRKAEALIQEGRVFVNGVVVTEMGIKVSQEDIIEVDGKKVKKEDRRIYIMLNKPVGYVSTAKDQFSRPTVIDIIQGVEERIYPVGRLDYDTSGLLILTNDGALTHKLTHPSHELKKIYMAEIQGIPDKDKLDNFRKGLKIEDYITAPADISIIKKKQDTSIVEISIHEGRNRQVRKMCEAIGHPVKKLKRIAIGRISLGDLEEGKWRNLTPDEVKSLKNK